MPLSNGIAYGEANSKRISNLVDIADLALFKLDEGRPGLLKVCEPRMKLHVTGLA